LLVGSIIAIPIMTMEFCCKTSALWVVGGFLLVPLEILFGLLLFPAVMQCKRGYADN